MTQYPVAADLHEVDTLALTAYDIKTIESIIIFNLSELYVAQHDTTNPFVMPLSISVNTVLPFYVIASGYSTMLNHYWFLSGCPDYSMAASLSSRSF